MVGADVAVDQGARPCPGPKGPRDSIITSRDGEEGEFKVRGIAEPESDSQVRAELSLAVEETLGWRPREPFFHLFRVALQDVSFIRYEQGNQRVVRWPGGRHVIRRETSPTSVGQAEEQADFEDGDNE